MSSQSAKSLVAYFSREGKNIISSGDVIDLPVGNTEVIALMIREAAGSDSFRIETVNPYPEDYRKATEVAKEELRANARPELTAHVENMTSYNVLFVGYPNWWGTMPMPVWTFLEEYDLTGKTIAPFCTHEGGSLGRSVTDIKALCPRSTILDGLAIRGSDVQRAKEQVSEWLCRLGVITG